MPNPAIRTRLSPKTANELLAYDKRSGQLTWRVNRGPKVKAGQPAGTLHPDNRRMVMINGKYWSANRLIWFLVMGALPPGRLVWRDNDPTNLTWRNIALESDFLSTRPVNIRQRRLRKRRKELIEAGSLRLDPTR